MVEEEKKKRIVSLDIVRWLAISLVVIVHSNGCFFTKDAGPYGSIVMHIIGCLGVPLFIVMTGYLMVDRDYNKSYLPSFIKKNLIPLFVAFESWNIIWFLLDKIPIIAPNDGGFPLSWERVAKAALFIGDTGTALWYMPMILGIYAGIPIISWVCKHFYEEKNNYCILILMLMIYFGTVVPTVTYVLDYLNFAVDIHSVLNMNIFGATVWGDSVWVLYCFLGFMVKKGFFERIKTRYLIAIGLVAAFILFYTEYDVVFEGNSNSLVRYASVFTVILTLSVFIMLMRMNRIFESIPVYVQKIITFVGTYSFSVYMIHLFVLSTFINAFLRHYSLPVGDSFPAPVLVIGYLFFVEVVVILSAASAWVCGHNKMIRKWLLLIK